MNNSSHTQPTASPSSATINAESASLQSSLASRTDLLDLSWEGLEDWCRQQGWPKYRAHQIHQWIYQRYQTDFSQMTDLPLSLREQLPQLATIGTLRVEQCLESQDGTRKLLCRLQDGARIEAVLIPDTKRLTLCVSSQVGCALGCKFCYTASMGPGRNLTVGEYMAQFIEASRILSPEQRITNVVFMGMGEPLINFERLMSTLTQLMDERGINLGRRRITISTAGLCPQIIELAQRHPVRLAISLHATTDQVRDQIMPINQRYPIRTLFAALKQYQQMTPNHRLPITLEYTLIADINDRKEDIPRLVKLARSIDAKINLIPYNEHPGAPYRRPTAEHIAHFRARLEESNVRTTCRMTRGDDIYAACGQLAIHAPTPGRKQSG